MVIDFSSVNISQSLGKKYSVIVSPNLGKIKCLGTCWRGSYSAGCSMCSLLFSYQTLTGPRKGLYPKDLFVCAQKI